MKCAHCSTPVPDDATFCHRCGSEVSDAEGQAAATAALNESHEQQLERLLRSETSGEFVIERLLGRGGMALVYLAKEIHLDRKIAIKVLPPELTFGHGVERFKREAKTAAALDHPHIIPIHRIAPSGKLFWYTMKYVEGRSLEEDLKQHKRLALEKTIEILEPVADALDYAHEHQVIHRDIKPANVMLDERDRVTVADFGIAKALTEATLTASGSVIGTPYYMSPEQGMGKPVSGASDQYSVAVMAYRMLSGQVPFDGDSAIDILHKHCKEPPPPLEVLLPNQPRYVYAAIDKALSKSPDDRFSTVTAFVKGLKQLSPEISAEMQTVSLDVDHSMEDKVSTKVIAITDDALPSIEEKAEAEQPATTGEVKKRKLLLRLIPLAIVMVVVGVAVVVWLTERPGPIDPEIQRIMNASRTDTPVESTTTGLPDLPEAIVPPPAPTTGVVTVLGLPASGTVRVDGVVQSDTIFELEAGDYTIEMSATGFGSNTTPLSVGARGEHFLQFTGAAAAVTTERAAVAGLPTVATVSVSIPNPEVTVGNEVTVRARSVDAAGNTLTGREVQWASSSRSVATVTPNGVVHGVAVGTARITATVGDQSASVNVTVIPVAVGAVNVSPANSAVFEGATVQLTASVEDGSGRPLSGRAVSWRSSNQSIATVSSTGLVTGIRAGSTNVTAQAGGRAGASTLTVKAAVVAEQVRPQAPAPQPISGPEDLFTQAAPAGWALVESQPPVIAHYDSRLGTIRILRVRQNTPEAILAGLRTTVAGRMTSLRELAPPEAVTTAGGESVLVQRFNGIQGSGFNEARFLVILAAAKNEDRAVGVMAMLEQYADPGQGEADLRELLRSLRQ